MNYQELKNKNLPDTPGVYFFLGPKKEILYVGKATSLRDRVKSYFTAQLPLTRGERFVEMVEKSKQIDFLSTESVLEALILEANKIQQYEPPYNTIGKDDKSFNYVVITDEDYPRVRVVRGKEISYGSDESLKGCFIAGPFPYGGELREALKIIRKIFPYRDDRCTPWNEQKNPENPKACWNAQIGLCPGVCTGKIDKTEYRKQIKRIKLFFQGKKNELTKNLEKDMKKAAKEEKFEKAVKLRRMLFALEHIEDIALIKHDLGRVREAGTFRIESYDIAHLSGKETVGVMIAIENGELDKSQYRKFKIRGKSGKVKIDDTNNLKEVLTRRFTHPEWPFPNLIVIDGGVGQINAAKKALEDISDLTQKALNIEIVSVVKDLRHKAKGILGMKHEFEVHRKSILLANSEAHRFAITYHRKLRTKGFRI